MDIKEQIALLDLVVRVFCLEKFLIEKNIISKEDYLAEINNTSDKIVKTVVDNFKSDTVKVEDVMAAVNKDKN